MKPRLATGRAWARRLAYPGVMGLCLGMFAVLRAAGASAESSAFLAVGAGAALVTWLEAVLPYRRSWAPARGDVANDLTFMVAVQIIVPKFLSFLVAVSLAGWVAGAGWAPEGWWPHALPPAAQAVLMLLAADFFRYWLHRASHEWSIPLWRLHAVHHSPHKLYWLNVGRFHPIEKAVQFLVDSLPFILVGVSQEVLAIYFVFYAVNGFFQHCNIDVRLGILNYVVSGPELHRWHHSWRPRESNHNYGNNLIVWDLLFGTRFLPSDREVERLGLLNRRYPLDFLHQLGTPFIKGADKEEPPPR